jgi:hypothetical protein
MKFVILVLTVVFIVDIIATGMYNFSFKNIYRICGQNNFECLSFGILDFLTGSLKVFF